MDHKVVLELREMAACNAQPDCDIDTLTRAASEIEKINRMLDRMGTVLLRASDGLEDCGDHAVLNSTNDADDIKTLAADWFEFRYLGAGHTCEYERGLCKHCGRPDHDGLA